MGAAPGQPAPVPRTLRLGSARLTSGTAPTQAASEHQTCSQGQDYRVSQSSLPGGSTVQDMVQ